MRRYYIAAVILVLIVIAATVSSSLVSKPHVTDRITTEDIRTLQSAISDYNGNNQKLPNSLNQLDVKADLKLRLTNYEYSKTTSSKSVSNEPAKVRPEIYPQPLTKSSYELCATFKTDTISKKSQIKIYDNEFDPELHSKGRQCFTNVVDNIEIQSDNPN